MGKIYRNNLSSNPGPIKIIKKNLDKISWDSLSENPHPEAIKI